MNVRERFHATCNFEPVDRPLRYEAWGFWDETIRRWHGEGLPETVIDPNFTAPDHFGFDKLSWLPIAVNTDHEIGFSPPFEEEVLEETEKYTIKRDIGGKIVKVFSDGHSTIPQYIDHPVKTLSDFEEIKQRLNPETPQRFTEILDIMITLANAAGDETFSAVLVSGIFGTIRHLMGLVPLSIAIKKDPALLHAISYHWVFMHEVLIKRIREKTPVDFIFFWEDMAYKNGPMISPDAFREFMSPYYTRLIETIKADTDIRNFCVDSDGDVSLLIPLFMESGITMMLPFEVQAGMDVRKVRGKHPDLVIWGGIDKKALFGAEAEMKKEIDEKVPFMLQKGGYIPCIDHNVPPEVPLENFETYLKIIRSLR
jgi:uroporphyrinogen decarboxylase